MRIALFTSTSVAHALRRAARIELERLLELMESGSLDVAAVHRMRRSTKRLAAMIDLTRAGGGPGWKRARTALRTVRRVLSPVRDLDVMMETLDALSEADPAAVLPGTRAHLRRRVALQRRRTADALRKDAALAALIPGVRRIVADTRHWRLDGSGIDALVPGLMRAHRRCRQALVQAQRTGSADAFHRWRGRLNALRLQLSLIRRSDLPRGTGASALIKGARQLGDANNLAVLAEYVSSEGATLLPALDCARLSTTAERRSRVLRRAAVGTAGRLCSMTTASWVRTLTRA